MKRDSGFSLIELLTITSLIGVLAFLSIVNYREYKTKALYSGAEILMKNARIAMEAGKIDVEGQMRLFRAWSTSQGMVTSGDGQTIAPGLNNMKDYYIFVHYDPRCNHGGCSESMVMAKTCKGNQYLSWARAGDGTESLIEHVSGGWGC